jgi:hypothetical protein
MRRMMMEQVLVFDLAQIEQIVIQIYQAVVQDQSWCRCVLPQSVNEDQ